MKEHADSTRCEFRTNADYSALVWHGRGGHPFSLGTTRVRDRKRATLWYLVMFVGARD